jgi:uncharacterized protein with PIN domain
MARLREVRCDRRSVVGNRVDRLAPFVVSLRQSYQRARNLPTDSCVPSLKLLADGMLGRLARWLRASGYDTVYAPDTDDAELLRLARAQERVLLTADHALAQRRGARTLLIEAQDLSGQLRQVREALGPPPGARFSRCVACNGELAPIEKSKLNEQVPPYVLATQAEFLRCTRCGRIFWPGTHVERMKHLLGDE